MLELITVRKFSKPEAGNFLTEFYTILALTILLFYGIFDGVSKNQTYYLLIRPLNQSLKGSVKPIPK